MYRPKEVRELLVFENDLIALVKNIKFRIYDNSSQTKLNKDIKSLRNSNKTVTFAGKTTNLYLLTKEEHDKLLQNAVTPKYKKVARKMKEKINKEGNRILNDKDVMKRLHINGDSNCLITMKDHKENFENKPSVRLINPAKNQIGRISKVILDKINVAIKSKLRLNQWKNTKEVIDWFASIDEKPLYKVLQFDITEFYPSIKGPLLEKALKFAEEYIEIPTDDNAIIKHT